MRLFSNITKIFCSLKLHLSQYQLLLLAVIISLLLHMLAISNFSLSLPELDEGRQTLHMRLVNLPPAQKLAPAAAKETVPVSNPEPPAAQQGKAVESESAPEPDVNMAPIAETTAAAKDTLSSASLNMNQTLAAPSPESSPSEVTEATPAAKSVAVAEEPREPIAAAEEPRKPAYNQVETEFEVFRGSNTAAAAVTRIIYNVDENGSYTINSTTEAKGMASLFLGTLVLRSEGMLTKNGLVPNFYLHQYGNDAKKLQTANFSWADGVLHLHSSKGDSTKNLVAGTQDELSFMYQFMFTPPLANMQITMTNGKRLRTYTYTFEGEEATHTKLGELKTIHLLKSSDEVEKFEIWLALDYQYLPIKIRKTENDGSIIEQVATKIATDKR